MITKSVLFPFKKKDPFSLPPDPDHRSTALSEQAAMLFVCLFFSPDTLKNDQNLMREVADPLCYVENLDDYRDFSTSRPVSLIQVQL